MNQNSPVSSLRLAITVLCMLLVVAIWSPAVTALHIFDILSANTSTGLIAVTPPSSAVPVWAAPGAGCSISTAGALSCAGTPFTLATPVVGEIPSGTVNGTNAAFTLANTPNSAYPLSVWIDGLHRFTENTDYTISGATITFASGAIPQTGQTVNVDYWH